MEPPLEWRVLSHRIGQGENGGAARGAGFGLGHDGAAAGLRTGVGLGRARATAQELIWAAAKVTLGPHLMLDSGPSDDLPCLMPLDGIRAGSPRGAASGRAGAGRRRGQSAVLPASKPSKCDERHTPPHPKVEYAVHGHKESECSRAAENKHQPPGAESPRHEPSRAGEAQHCRQGRPKAARQCPTSLAVGRGCSCQAHVPWI